MQFLTKIPQQDLHAWLTHLTLCVQSSPVQFPVSCVLCPVSRVRRPAKVKLFFVLFYYAHHKFWMRLHMSFAFFDELVKFRSDIHQPA